MTKQNNFDDEFKKRIADLETRAHKAGLNFTSICREAKISRATPDRWKRETPKTIQIVARMESIVAKREEALASVRPR